MIAIYSITNTVNNKKYIGACKDTTSRWYSHKCNLKKENRHKDFNKHLHADGRIYGADVFKFEIIETFETYDKSILLDREAYWMDHYNTKDRGFGYNIRQDALSGGKWAKDYCDELKGTNLGEKNPNYGNRWSDEQKQKMSDIAKDRHSGGLIYGEEWRNKMSISSIQTWSDFDKRKDMVAKVKIAKRKYIFDQFTRENVFIRTWDSVDDIILENPTYKWQNIYSVCNGYKPTYMNYIWKKRDK